MEFKFIDYKIFETKKILKNAKLLFIFHSTRLKSKTWLLVEQVLKTIKLDYYKVYNIITNMIIKNSIFKNNNKLIVNGTTLFSSSKQNLFENSTSELLLTAKLANTHSLLTFLFTKINNKLYSNFQTKKITSLKHKTNFLILCYSLEKSFKKKVLSYL